MIDVRSVIEACDALLLRTILRTRPLSPGFESSPETAAESPVAAERSRGT